MATVRGGLLVWWDRWVRSVWWGGWVWLGISRIFRSNPRNSHPPNETYQTYQTYQP